MSLCSIILHVLQNRKGEMRRIIKLTCTHQFCFFMSHYNIIIQSVLLPSRVSSVQNFRKKKKIYQLLDFPMLVTRPALHIFLDVITLIVFSEGLKHKALHCTVFSSRLILLPFQIKLFSQHPLLYLN
jgi:hypothetical protein